jgi:hypothetical protein
LNKGSGNTVIQGVPATATASVGIPKITVTMPLALMVRGFVLAVRRYEAAVAAHEAADAHIAMFEISNWLDHTQGKGPPVAS